MRREIEIEEMVVRIARAVERGQDWEDYRVELKGAWSDKHERAARQIAGALNAAAPEPVCWIFGLDAKRGFVDFDLPELDSWWRAVAKHFHQVCPTFRDVVVPYDDRELLALRFEPNRAPYVIEGNDGGRVRREVFWREGTGTRPARRDELIQILSPASHAPSFDMLHATVQSPNNRKENPVSVTLFVYPASEERVVIPTHEMEIRVTVGEHNFISEFVNVETMGGEAALVRGVPGSLIADGPGAVRVKNPFKDSEFRRALHSHGDKDINVEIRGFAASARAPSVVSGRLQRLPPERDSGHHWQLGVEPAEPHPFVFL